MKQKGKVIMWSSLTGVSLVLMIALSVGTSLARGQFRNVVNDTMHTEDFELVKGEDSGIDTEYFKKKDLGSKDIKDYDKEIAEELSAEGITLLQNDNSALPLSKNIKVTLFGAGAANIVVHGGGSAAISSIDDPVTMEEALESVNIQINKGLYDELYKHNQEVGNIPEVSSTSFARKCIGELPLETYKQYSNTYSEYNDAAIVVLSRMGAELADMKDYTDTSDVLSLNNDEIDMFNYVKSLKDEGVFKKIIVILNTTNAINFNYKYETEDETKTGTLEGEDFIKDFGVDATVWIGYSGTYGLNSLAKILVGDINPSGNIVDTFAYDNKNCPAYVDFFGLDYKNATIGQPLNNGVEGAIWHSQGLDGNTHYSIYSEGIYIGYRYFETRYEDVVLGNDLVGNYDYSSTVKYPFGYGISYTDFEQKITDVKETENSFEFTVNVKNSGDVAGKDAIQIYFQSPYTDYDIDNKIEKSAIELCGFAKTDLLDPGADFTTTISVPKSELYAYDSYGKKTYIMDAGDYYFSLGNDSHDALNNILTAKGMTTSNGMTEAGNGDASHVYKYVHDELTIHDESTTTGNKITNQFDHANLNYYYEQDNIDEEYTYLTRNNWEGTYPKVTTAGNELEATASMKKGLYTLGSYESDPNTTVKMPTQGQFGELTLASMIGLDYNDPKWELLLNQVSIDEMASLIDVGFHTTMAISSIAKPKTVDDNGPQGFTTTLIDGASKAYCAYTDENIMAATFNVDLIEEVGEAMGNDMLNRGDNVAGLYGPAMNTHRTAYGGRNFEYYSEDGFLAGKIAAAEVKGIQKYGNYVYIKHFALNDQETQCRVVSTFANEQAIREIYLKPFQLAIEEGGAMNVMNSFARIGTTWSGADKGLMTNVLRDEWGLKGFAITDYNAKELVAGDYSVSGYSFDVIAGLLAGTDTWDNRFPGWNENLLEYRDDPVIVSAMRQATKRICYTVANSHAMNGISPNDKIVRVTPYWEVLLIVLSTLFGVLTALFGTMLGLTIYKGKKQNIK